MSKNQKKKDFSNQRFRDRLLGRINEFYKNADDIVVSLVIKQKHFTIFNRIWKKPHGSLNKISQNGKGSQSAT